MSILLKSIHILAAATALLFVFEPRNILADALDVWHTNATFSASGIAYGNGKFVAVTGTSLQISPDGTNWTQYISPPVLHYEGIVFGGSVFMSFGYPVSTNSSGPHYILESSDGIHWTNVYQTTVQITGATYGNNQFVFTGSHIISATLNPLQWAEFAPGITLGEVTCGAGQFVAVSGGAILSSADGLIWQYDYATNNQYLGNVAYGNGMFVVTCNTNGPSTPPSEFGFLVSSNLASWQFVQLGSSSSSSSPGTAEITFGGGYFIGALLTSSGYNTYTSTNGLNWVNRVRANGATLFTFAAGSFVANGNGLLLQSGVFASPSNSPPSSLTIATYPGVTITGTAGATYQIQYTTNLNSTWLPLTNFSLPYSPLIWVDTSSPVVGQRFYRSVQLQ